MIKVPPIKIQGIKTKLVSLILSHTRWDGRGRWIEPFLGSGVVLFNAAPERAVVADTNEHIIRFYQAIQSAQITPDKVRIFLNEQSRVLAATEGEYYYEVRRRFNEEGSPLDFLFLNRACFNGLIRFNSRGEFNVPFCRKPNRFSPAYITKICNQVSWVRDAMKGKEWDFRIQDWRVTLQEACTEDFVYIDPPYNDRHTDYYNKWDQSESDALAAAIKRLEAGFAYSTWKQNKYRINSHLTKYFGDYPCVTMQHFYHVGSTEQLRNAMEEAVVIASRSLAANVQCGCPSGI